jgi:uncharacterized membrane protein
MLNRRGKKKKKVSRHNQPPVLEAGVVKRTVTAAAFSGPLPLPAMLREYEEILPGSAHRIVTMAESQGAHRQRLEQQVVTGDSRRSNLGLASGFVVAIVGFVVAGYFAYLGHPIEGTVLASADLVALVGVFIYGTTSRKAERTSRVEALSK